MNKKYLGLIGLSCGVLLLAGCGGGKTLKCTTKTRSYEMTKTYTFNSDETKTTSIEETKTYDYSNDTDENIKKYKEELEESCNDSYYKKCKVTSSGKKVTLTAEVADDFVSEKSLEEVKELAKMSGYVCE